MGYDLTQRRENMVRNYIPMSGYQSVRPSQLVCRHAQTEQYSCAASGMEVLLKCHGKLAIDDLSLQKKYGNANIGFGEAHELESRGLKPANRTEKIALALQEILNETRAGRYPLISLPVKLMPAVKNGPATIECHIFVAEESPNGLRIVDPANRQVVDGSLNEFETIIGAMMARTRHPFPTDLNFLTYGVEPK